ncbi:MAG: cupredoxin domain-containing protein [Candidatus Omnitrophica bacterium]|nr:cupredoxin domain-containing protein [Candidatus Omnitrophota bacterium]
MKKYFILCATFFLLVSMISQANADNLMLARGGGRYRSQDRAKTLRDAASAQKAKDEAQALSGRVESGVRIVEIKASQYAFEPDTIVVNRGEKVRLVVASTDAAHGLTIREFNVNLAVQPGKTESIEFTPDKKGVFDSFCSAHRGLWGGRRHARLIVK